MKNQPELLAEYSKLFRTFTRAAFRLETLPQYLVPSEEFEFREFLAGRPLPPPRSGENAEWDRLIADNVTAGKTMQRVHLLPEKLTPYLKFELEWAYLYTATAGEDIRLLRHSAPHEIRRLATEDYWMFDEATVFYPRYDREGRFVGVEKADSDEAIQRCRVVRDEVLPHAVTLRDYLVSIRTV